MADAGIVLRCKGRVSWARRGGRYWLVLLLALVARPDHTCAQLAITEVMSVASTNSSHGYAVQNSDFWELTNYGAEDIPLDGYRWNDAAGGLLGADDFPFWGVIIHAGESIVFVQMDAITNEVQFREWWGPALPSGTQLIFYLNNGFNTNGDGVRLWTPDGSLAASVDFGAAQRGRTLTYDPGTGNFGAFSLPGAEGVTKAATRDDFGSPGRTAGPVPIQILASPASVTSCAGVDVRFSVQVAGMPRPRLQWLFNGNELPGALDAQLVIPDPQLANAGQYLVLVDNGFESKRSSVANLTIRDDPAAPNLARPLTDVEILVQETARFVIAVCANPRPTYQWYDGQLPLPGETNRTLVLRDCQLAQSGTRYSVSVSNRWGRLMESALLTVRPKPHVIVSEVMAAPADGCPAAQGDWFELTNLGDEPANLQGWRFAETQSLEGACVVEQALVLAPGQSAVFVEKIAPEAFRRWWGEGLPPDVVVLTVPTLGLKQSGEAIYVWSAGAESPFDANSIITSMSYSSAPLGASLEFDDGDCLAGCLPVDGVKGAFRSAQCGDLGSPGTFNMDPPLRMTNLEVDANGTTVRYRAVTGRRYRIESRPQLLGSTWTTIATQTATNGVSVWRDNVSPVGAKFYHVVEAP